MSVPRLHTPAPLQKSARIELTEAQMHYLRGVMRLKEGDTVRLFNGVDGEWSAQLTSLHKKYAGAEVQEKLRVQMDVPDIWLCFAPIKHARQEFMLEKATELGVRALQPVMTQFTQSSRVNVEKLRFNAIEAAEQSERLDVPEVREPLTFEQLLGSWPKERLLIYGDETGESAAIGEVLNSLPPLSAEAPPRTGQSESLYGAKADTGGAVALLIGPEGGFSKDEHYILRTQPFARGMCLGPRVLRAETAAIAALACMFSACGDWDLKPKFC